MTQEPTKRFAQEILSAAIAVAVVLAGFVAVEAAAPRWKPKPVPAPVPAPAPAPVAAKLLYANEFTDATSIAAGSNIKTTWPLGQGYDSRANDSNVCCYCDTQGTFNPGPNPFSFTNGVLSITARPTSGLPKPLTYTSGMLCTAGKFSFTYGYVEARAKIPGGAPGFWPLIWMMKDTGTKSQTWPPEIDLLQCSSDSAKGTIRFETFNAVLWGNSAAPQEYGDFCSIGVDLTADFHLYGMEWTATKINWYIDNKLVLTRATPNGVNVPMYLMVNLAVGGDPRWIGVANGSVGVFQIDYLRVYSSKP